MFQSKLFTKTQKEPPKDEAAINAQYLTRGGFIYKNSAGVYSFLPLGFRVIQKIAAIIREEMNAIGGQEILMPALVEKKYLDATGRWDVDVGFEVSGKKDKSADFVLGWTHEEVLTAIAGKYISSYKDLPFAAYQIQTKFRNEPRAKSGLLRGREFMMKDLYSFHADESGLNRYYEQVRAAYLKIFERVGLETVYTVAAGGDFTAENTHEFQVLSPVGEDTIFVCAKRDYAENKEISKLKSGDNCPSCGGKIEEQKSIEVANIFPLGTKYSQAFNLQYSKKSGEKADVAMGSYGIGLGRVMGTIVEVFHDEAGIIWPESVAPFQVHLLELGASGQKIYDALLKAGIEVLYDDRDESAGAKFADADLMGIPYRAVISAKTGDKIELKRRGEEKTELVSLKELVLESSSKSKAPNSK
ncbi:MAG: aminoacyl--tRNA ligase-related protein [Candidatus Doudnabacteria bacterium]|nr:aminoacyl--tRNA ligase-related protein [bacterium]MDZ4243524.1 aminoacyl--tRNA ligase-related protein [Candidatus Doudnabacteria bacterium]